MSTNISIKSKVNYNQIAGIDFVIPDQTRTAITTPVDGQIVWENGIAYVYVLSKTKWVPLGSGMISIKGTVGDTSTHPEWLSNLPDTPDLQDAYYVGTDGKYGPGTDSQAAHVGDLFVCIAEKTSTTAAKWTLVPSGNGRYTATVTGDGTNSQYTINHTLNTSELSVTVYEQTYDTPGGTTLVSEDLILVSTKVTTTTIVLDFANVQTTNDKYKVVVLAG